MLIYFFGIRRVLFDKSHFTDKRDGRRDDGLLIDHFMRRIVQTGVKHFLHMLFKMSKCALVIIRSSGFFERIQQELNADAVGIKPLTAHGIVVFDDLM